MDLTFEMSAGTGVPIGHYNAEFVRAEIFDENADRYGRGVKLIWKVTGGEQDGQEATRICSAKMSPKSNLYKFVQAFNGGPIDPGTKVNLESFYGIAGMIVVEECGDGGSTRVTSFLRQG